MIISKLFGGFMGRPLASYSRSRSQLVPSSNLKAGYTPSFTRVLRLTLSHQSKPLLVKAATLRMPTQVSRRSACSGEVPTVLGDEPYLAQIITSRRVVCTMILDALKFNGKRRDVE